MSFPLKRFFKKKEDESASGNPRLIISCSSLISGLNLWQQETRFGDPDTFTPRTLGELYIHPVNAIVSKGITIYDAESRIPPANRIPGV